MFIVLAGWVAGSACRPPEPAPFPVWAPPSAPYEPKAGSGNGFDRYARAALEVERAAPDKLDRVYFPTQRMRAAVLRELEGPLREIRRGSREPVTFAFRPVGPFEPGPFRRGWRLLGRALVWQLEEALEGRRWEEAVATYGTALRFAFDLTGGDATDASLGLAIAEDVRRALAPLLAELPADALEGVAAQTAGALARKPPLETPLRHEGLNMMRFVQDLQDRYRSDDFRELEERLGPEIRPAIEALRALRRDDSRRRPAYFAALAREAAEELDRQLLRAAQPYPSREPWPASAPGAWPYGRFVRHFFRAGRALLEADDLALTRTRLLATEALILASIRKEGRAPRDLSRFPAELVLDPYSGGPFVYRSDGMEYQLYSLGGDGRDDGGLSDETGTRPDAVPESRLGRRPSS